eukprot:scaffold149006_cov21-Tisochrysis_lutea.AAC.1
MHRRHQGLQHGDKLQAYKSISGARAVIRESRVAWAASELRKSCKKHGGPCIRDTRGSCTVANHRGPQKQKKQKGRSMLGGPRVALLGIFSYVLEALQVPWRAPRHQGLQHRDKCKPTEAGEVM